MPPEETPNYLHQGQSSRSYSHRSFTLLVRQQPKHSRMCGFGEKFDRRPIDPPPVIQLLSTGSLSKSAQNALLSNSNFFMYASLCTLDKLEDIHILRDGKTRSTTGSLVSSLYRLKDLDNNDAGFFVFPDLSVRMEGDYKLRFSLFELVGTRVVFCQSIMSDAFHVYPAKKFPGMEESTMLSRCLADQGLKIRIRKELRIKKVPFKQGDGEQPTKSPSEPSVTSPTTSIMSSLTGNQRFAPYSQVPVVGPSQPPPQSLPHFNMINTAGAMPHHVTYVTPQTTFFSIPQSSTTEQAIAYHYAQMNPISMQQFNPGGAPPGSPMIIQYTPTGQPVHFQYLAPMDPATAMQHSYIAHSTGGVPMQFTTTGQHGQVQFMTAYASPPGSSLAPNFQQQNSRLTDPFQSSTPRNNQNQQQQQPPQ